jgi:hypothetical protein
MFQIIKFFFLKDKTMFDLILYTKDPNTIKHKLKRYLQTAPDGVVVFDIDETLFINVEVDKIARHPLGESLYKIAESLGRKIVLVTAREGDPSSRKYLLNQLKQMKFENFDMIFMQPQSAESTAAYKYEARQIIKKKFNRIILNVGDQLGDHFEQADQQEQLLMTVLHPKTYYVLKIEDDPSELSLKLIEY